MNKKHPLANKSKITLKEYLESTHVAIRSDDPASPSIIEETLRSLGHARRIKVGLPYIGPIFKLIEETSGCLLGTVIQRMATLYRKNYDYVIKPLPFKMPDIEFYLAWHQRHEQDAGHQWLRQQLIEANKTG